MEGTFPKPRLIVCPWCEAGRLLAEGSSAARCGDCGYAISGQLFRTLREATTLPEVVGRHACECGYPEMRLLPDGVYWCPACRAEVTPVGAPAVKWKTDDRPESYWQGWLDGRFAQIDDFTGSARLARWENPEDRLEYYQGHRAGSREREEAKASRAMRN